MGENYDILRNANSLKCVNDQTCGIILVIHNTMEYIYSTYGVMKDVNPLVKNSLEKSEDIAFWIRQKTNDVVKATHLEEPLKKLDSAAANSVTKVEQTSNDVRFLTNFLAKTCQSQTKASIFTAKSSCNDCWLFGSNQITYSVSQNDSCLVSFSMNFDYRFRTEFGQGFNSIWATAVANEAVI